MTICRRLGAIISCGNDDPNLGRGFGGRGDQDRGRALSAGRTDPDLIGIGFQQFDLGHNIGNREVHWFLTPIQETIEDCAFAWKVALQFAGGVLHSRRRRLPGSRYRSLKSCRNVGSSRREDRTETVHF